MHISFNPPLGDAVSVATSSFPPQTQTTPLLFTAQLTAHDYDLLVRNGGRVQLWSNIPRHGESNGDWADMDFTDICEPAQQSSGAYTISLRENPPLQDGQDTTLCLSISLPPINSGPQHFSFTYRIVYSSGEVTWLGDFGQNGSLILQQSVPNTVNGLALEVEPEWHFDQLRTARILETKGNVSSLQLAKLNLSDFRIWALGTDSLLPNSKNASLLFLVPRVRRLSLTLLPTYILATSPDLFITLSDEGALTVSGSGTVLLQIHEIHSEMRPFLEQLILHCKLDNWSLLTCDTRSQALVLALMAPHYPVHAVVIPLWPSDYIVPTLQLDLVNLTQPFLGGTKEFALFSPHTNQLYCFNMPRSDELETQNLLLEFGSTGSDFLLCPIYRLQGHNSTTKKNSRNWGVALLTPYNKVSSPFLADDSAILPTPPPSPHLRPTTYIPRTSSSPIDTLLSSVTTLPSNTGISTESLVNGENAVHELLQDLAADEDKNAIPPSVLVKALPPRNVLSSFRSIFSSVGSFLRLFFKIFWCPILPFGSYRIPPPPKAAIEEENSTIMNLDDDVTCLDQAANALLVGHAPDLRGPAEFGVQTISANASEGDTTQDTQAAEPTLIEVEVVKLSVVTTENIVISGAQCSLDKPEEPIFYGELVRNQHDMAPSRITAAIVLMPSAIDTPVNTDEGHNSATSSPNLDEGLVRAIRFLDGSPPQCMVSRINLFSYDESVKDRPEVGDIGSCYLLQFQLDWDGAKKGRVISVSRPEGPMV